MPSFAERYREWSSHAGGSCPIESGIVGVLADNECRHGRLPNEGEPCGCWPHFEMAAPDLMGVFHDAQENKEQNMDAPATPAAPEAPFGYKADGVTPRRRPAPSPQAIAAAREGRERAARERAARRRPAAAAEHKPPTRVASSTPAPVSLVDRLVGPINEEIARLEQLREQVMEALAA